MLYLLEFSGEQDFWELLHVRNEVAGDCKLNIT